MLICWRSTNRSRASNRKGSDRMVNYENREHYCALLIDFLLNKSVESMMRPLREGFMRVCRSPVFMSLSPEELELVMCGERDLDFTHLRESCEYRGFDVVNNKEHKDYIEGLWDILINKFTP